MPMEVLVVVVVSLKVLVALLQDLVVVLDMLIIQPIQEVLQLP